jgi:N-acetyl-gamma-glutamyl-phosphate reductase
MIACAFPLNELKEMYQQYYKDDAFTHVCDNMIDLKQVVNTNKCLLHLEKRGNKLVIHSALDNLLKGASGQAVQNMNLMFGLPETGGLQLKASAF